MAVDKEAISLSRVYSNYSKCNVIGLLCVTRLYEILVYSIIEHINTRTCTIIVDNLFHTLMVLCENELDTS